MYCTIVFLAIIGFIHGSPQQSKDNLRIHHGRDTHYPFVLYLHQSNETHSFQCTATLIEPQIILTAGHCLHKHLNKPLVTYGCQYLKTRPCKNAVVVDWMASPDDIAVGKLERPLENIRPIDLPKGRWKKWVPSGDAVLVGYGKTETGATSLVQQITKLPIIKSPYTGVNLGNEIFVRHYLNRVDVGDSGGPLIIHDTQYGVLSSGSSEYSVYMSVNYYREFIDSSIASLLKNTI